MTQAKEIAPKSTEAQQHLLELKETNKRLEAYELENIALRRNYDLTTQSLVALSESLAEANAEAELFRRQFASMQLRMEALGMATVIDGRELLEQRLLKGMRDMELGQRRKDAVSERLVALAESVFRYLKTATGDDARARLDVETELRSTNEALGVPLKHVAADVAAVPASLKEGMVVSVKEEWSLLVANVGRRQGVRLGMPMVVVRGDAYVGRVRVVEVRESISGAIIEDRGTADRLGRVRVGDQLRVEVQDTRVSDN